MSKFNNSVNNSFGYETNSNNIQFETMLNSLNDWQNNPAETTRHCLKYLYNLSRIQQKKIENLEKQKATKSELTSGLNIKGNIADIMRTFNEVAQNIDQRPTKEEINYIINEKINKIELSKGKNIDLKNNNNNINENSIKTQIKNSINDLARNFVTIKEFSDVINSKASKNVINDILNQKANKDDINLIINDIKEYKSLSQKINEIDNDLDRLIDNIKKQFNSINNVLNNITNTKIELKDLESVIEKINEYDKNSLNNYTKLNNEIAEIKSNINNMNIKYNSITESINNIDTMSSDNKNKNENIFQNLDNKLNILTNEINNNKLNLNEKISKNDLDFLNQKINSLEKNLNDKNYITDNDVENISNKIKSDLQSQVNDFQKYIKDYLKNFDDELINNINTKANISDIEELLSLKNDISNLIPLINSKANIIDIENIKLTLEKISQDNLNYVNYNKLDSFILEMQSEISQIKNDLILKGNINETMSYLNNKANIDDVNTALTEIHKELDNKLNLKDFNHSTQNSNTIISTLIKENTVAKWLWESGEVKNGYLVPWEKQISNTSPENFLWEDMNIIIKNSGIYLLNLCFFVRDKPTVQVLINGEGILSQVNSNAYIIRHEKNDMQNKENISGICMNEFLCLDEMSRISISYCGDNNVKGIMCIKEMSC